MGLNMDSLVWVLAQAEGAPGGFLSKNVIIIAVVVLIVVAGIYWYRGRSK